MASHRGEVQPSPGDLIEVYRSGYQHWALYVGNGHVIHLAPPCEVAGAGIGSLGSITCDGATIQKVELKAVVGGDSYRVNNQLDDKYEPLPVGNFIRAAELQVGRTIPYHLFTNNCEHWVNNMRYGVPESRQIRNLVLAGVGAGVRAAAGPLALPGLIHMLTGTSKNTNQRNGR
ncbi:hypothetical protein Pmani_008734 [Petrolisthes manimaculis]|uniref:LRAT domain-containing protein n=1 Tax=Petrolisthes manimaculis TaxID=1843537 RepID=A0AAE1Q5Z4_9EUCA|nr:hypothetical protein Pmani_008734 [Petrolisthes manimaculis]